jgi:hypothetical protein
MATITVQIILCQNVDALTGAAIEAILAWVKNNIAAQLPNLPNATATVTYAETP